MDVQNLLNAAPSINRVAEVARCALSERKPRTDCPRYFAALDSALAEGTPVFATQSYAEIYRAASASGHWLAVSLITNAEREGDGAKRLWSLAACCHEDEEQQLLKRHACDESKHALAYLALLDLAFPGAVTPEFRTELDQLSPHFSMEQELRAVPGSPYAHTPSTDDYMQMNIAEIRTTIHHLMQRQALTAHCPAKNMPKTRKILDMLLRDELSHVAYTAVLIEQKTESRNRGEVEAQFSKRLHDFNRSMSEEAIDYSYNQRFGMYP
jgi:hypothetical protein